MSKVIEALENEQMTKKIPEFSPGDTVIVQVKVKEGTRERLQAFEGIVIAKRNRGLNSSFTVRKISHGEGVERVFQTYSSVVSDINVKGRSDQGKDLSCQGYFRTMRNAIPINCEMCHNGLNQNPVQGSVES